MFSIQNNFCKKRWGGGGGGNCGHRRVKWHESEVSTVASKFFSFLFDAYRRAVWHEVEVSLNASDNYKRHLVRR